MGTLVTGTAATYVEELWVNTDKRYQIMCITRDVQNIVKQSGISEHLVMLMILNLDCIMIL